MPVLRLPITIIGAASLLCAALLMAGGGPAASATIPVVAPAVPRSAGRVLWAGDAETGDLSQFQDGPWNDVGGTAPRIVTSPVRSGRYAVQLGISGATTADDGICCGSRNELLPAFRDLEEGDDLYFGFSTYLAPGFPLDAEWQVITQFKQNFDGSPPLSLNVEEGQYKIEGGYGHPAGPRQFIEPVGAVTVGTWVDWVLHVKFSADPRVGFVEVWQNGAEVLPRFAPPGGTLYPGKGDRAGSYVKTGPYRDPAVTTPETMYLDNWRIGTSRDAVEP
jgi:hypothetical protein